MFARKVVSALLIVSILCPSLFLSLPRKAEATIPTIDYSNLTQTISTALSTALSASYNYLLQYKETVLDTIVYYGARILIRQLTQSIVDWINSGFNGNPSFLQDPQSFLENTADRAIGEFIFSSDLNFLCDPFQVNVRLALGLQYSPFKDTINCRLTDVLKNTKGAYEDFVGGDFIGGGGWDSWLSITTVPQNNQLGAMLIAQSELDARINGQKVLTNDELNRNGGFLSMKQCTRTIKDREGKVISSEKYMGDSGYMPLLKSPGQTTSQSNTANIRENSSGQSLWTGSTEDKCKTVTPGVLINEQLQQSVGSDLSQLQLADEINEIVGALANFMVTKIMEVGVSGYSQRDKNKDEAEWKKAIADLTNQQNANLGRGVRNSTSRDLSGLNDGLGFLYYTDPANPNSAGTISSNDPQKKYILDTVALYQPNEGRYYLAYLSIERAIKEIIAKFTKVTTCFDTKLANTSITYTSSERQEATLAKNAATYNIGLLETVRTEIQPNLLDSQTKVDNLGKIAQGTNQATSYAQLTVLEKTLTDLIPSLHSQASTTEAQAYASSTILTKISPKGPVADDLQEQCDAFPDR